MGFAAVVVAGGGAGPGRPQPPVFFFLGGNPGFGAAKLGGEKIFRKMLSWCRSEITKKHHSTDEMLFITAAMSYAIDGISKMENDGSG